MISMQRRIRSLYGELFSCEVLLQQLRNVFFPSFLAVLSKHIYILLTIAKSKKCNQSPQLGIYYTRFKFDLFNFAIKMTHSLLKYTSTYNTLHYITFQIILLSCMVIDNYRC